MILYVKGLSNVKDVVIDFIEVTLKSGEQVSLSWDESEYDRTDNGSFEAVFKGISFDDEYANGHENNMFEIAVDEVGFFSKGNCFSENETFLTEITMQTEDENVVVWEADEDNIREKLNTALYEKLFDEQRVYVEWLLAQEPEEILQNAYEYNAREDILCAQENDDVEIAEARALLSMSFPLKEIFEILENRESDYMETVHDCIQDVASKILCGKTRKI